MKIACYFVSVILQFGLLFSATASVEVNADSGYVDSFDGEKLFYKTIGEGDPVIVIHGGPGWYSKFDYNGLKGLGKHFKVIFYDQRGSGKSKTAINSETISLDVFHKDINSLLSHFEYESAHFIGISFGALLAITYSFKHIENVKKMIFLAPTGLDSSYPQAINATLQQRLGQKDMAEFQAVSANEKWLNSPSKQASERFRIMFRGYTQDLKWLNSLDFKMDDFTARSQPQITNYMMKSLGNFDFYDELNEIENTPTLIIRGDYDPLPRSYVEQIHKNIENSEMTEMKGVGHFPHYEARGHTLDAISDFLYGN